MVDPYGNLIWGCAGLGPMIYMLVGPTADWSFQRLPDFLWAFALNRVNLFWRYSEPDMHRS